MKMIAILKPRFCIWPCSCLPEAPGRAYGALWPQHQLLAHRVCSGCRWSFPSADPPTARWAAPPSARQTEARPVSLETAGSPAQFPLLDIKKGGITLKRWCSMMQLHGLCADRNGWTLILFRNTYTSCRWWPCCSPPGLSLPESSSALPPGSPHGP